MVNQGFLAAYAPDHFVSIGIPFYNAEKYLLDAVRSVFAQTYQNWELILLDDGSTDKSLQIALSIDDPRVRVYSDGVQRRLAARLNQIVQLSRYDLVARMDADDLMSRDRIEKQVRIIESDPHVDLVTAGVCSLTEGNEPVGFRCVSDNHKILPRELLEGKAGILHGAILGRREWFLRNPYNEELPRSQDTNLWIRAFAKKDLNIQFISEPLYYYREDGNVTVDKLLLSYRLHRSMIWRDATAEFGTLNRSRAFVSSCVKSMAVHALAACGRLDLVRKRRNAVVLGQPDKIRVVAEISELRSYPIPLKD